MRLLKKVGPAAALAIGVTVVTFTIYIPTLAPGITWRNGGVDSGDFAASVAVLGIPHPPGYPTYMLLGWLWSSLPLGGEIAYRLNLLSALAAAIAAGLSAAAISRLGRRLGLTGWPPTLGAAFGSLSLALAPLTWSQATITEVYAPGLAALSLLTLALLAWYNHGGRRWPVIAGLVGGLGLGLLPQLILAAPGALALAYLKTRQGHPSRGDIAAGLAAFGLGLSTFAYLPLRAIAQPPINWGDPSSWSRFWAVVTAAQYHHYFNLLGPGEWLNRLGQSLAEPGHQLGWSGVGLALAGSYSLWQQQRAVLSYLLSLAGLTLLFRASYPVQGNVAYLLPVLYALALLAGIGTAWLLALAHRHIGRAGYAIIGLGLLATLGVRGLVIAPRLNLSADREAALFSQRVLAALPAEALLLSERDEATFSLWYRQVALGQRPDVAIVDRRLLPFEWYQRQLTRRYPDLDPAKISRGELNEVSRPIYELDRRMQPTQPHINLP